MPHMNNTRKRFSSSGVKTPKSYIGFWISIFCNTCWSPSKINFAWAFVFLDSRGAYWIESLLLDNLASNKLTSLSYSSSKIIISGMNIIISGLRTVEGLDHEGHKEITVEDNIRFLYVGQRTNLEKDGSKTFSNTSVDSISSCHLTSKRHTTCSGASMWWKRRLRLPKLGRCHHQSNQLCC